MKNDQLACAKQVPFVSKSNVERHLAGGFHKIALEVDVASEKQNSTNESNIPLKNPKIGTTLKQFSNSQVRVEVPFRAKFDLHIKGLHENGQSIPAMF